MTDCSASSRVTEHPDNTEVLQILYHSKIPWHVSALWNGSVDWELGIHASPLYVSGHADTLDEAVQQLAEAARERYPESLFALGREEFERRRAEVPKSGIALNKLLPPAAP